jgi:hypothetical protein
MKVLSITKRSYYLTLAAVGLWLAGAAPSHAATVTPNPVGHQSGLTYEWGVTMGGSDSATYSGSVGAKSWAEPAKPIGAKGWTHTSNWVQLDLSEMHVPGVLTITMDRGATGSLFPAFSIYSGWELDTPDAANHTFNNMGAIS